MAKAVHDSKTSTPSKERVTYLFGAGASHACAAAARIEPGILMRHLTLPVKRTLGTLLNKEEKKKGTKLPRSVHRLVNDIDDDTDLEQLITFLEESGSEAHEAMAGSLRYAFQSVLAEHLDPVRKKIVVREGLADLYAVLIDIHEVLDQKEELRGFMTLNYDDLLENAIESLELEVDRGIGVHSHSATQAETAIRVLSLHGSLSWTKTWPVHLSTTSSYSDKNPALWIPPGIRKSKGHYPFNTIWGLAREMLDCDTLRIVGCSLGKNDWDLVSMLFSTRHAHADDGEPYTVEIIGSPRGAQEIKKRFPYLEAKTLLEIPDIGENVYIEALPGGVVEKPYLDLPEEEQEEVRGRVHCDGNPFRYWLKHKGEAMDRKDRSDRTKSGLFHDFLESY